MNYLGLQRLYINFASTAKKNLKHLPLGSDGNSFLGLALLQLLQACPTNPPLLLLLPSSQLSISV